MEREILRAGRRQLAERGAAALSLREVARDLGVASSAVYRYVDSRDALLTLLLVDAHTDLADAVDGRLERLGTSAGGERKLHCLAHAMFDWARENRAQWALVHGSPVPGYHAPAEETAEAGTRIMGRFLDIASSGTPRAATTGPAYEAFLEDGASQLGSQATLAQAAAAVRARALIIGTVTMIVFDQIGPEPLADIAIGKAALDDAVRAAASDLGL